MKPAQAFLIAALLATPALADDFGTPGTLKAIQADDGMQIIGMEVGNYFYKPNHLVVKVHKPVRLTIIVNPTIGSHNFILNAPEANLDLHIALKEGQNVIKFTPEHTGKFQFFCDKRRSFLESHRTQGEIGLLEVTE